MKKVLLVALCLLLFMTACEERCNHSYGEWTVEKPSTCGVTGVSSRACVYCQEKEYREIETVAHTFVNNECACGSYQESKGLAFEECVEGIYALSGLGTCRDTCVVIPDTYNGKPVEVVWPIAYDEYSNKVKKIVVPNSVKTISREAFRGMQSLKTVVLSNGVSQLMEYTFYDCSSLEEVVIPSGVTKIGNFCFSECTALKMVVFSDTVSEIGDQAFENCTALEQITLPASLRTIRIRAFDNCKLLQISFAGTKEQFGSIYREGGWCRGIVSRLVSCSNGNYIIETGRETG